MKKLYQPQIIEAAAQKYWEETAAFVATEDPTREKFYCLSMLPYPSGTLHMGHVRNYTIGDLIARYQRMLGKNVLQPLGWDAFGLPAENAALQNNLAPSEWTYANIKEMRSAIKLLGFAIDWTRELTTCDPNYYRFEQQLFLKMYRKGLAYKKKSVVNWDPVDQTVLANEQVIEGRGWRSGAIVEQKEIDQWFLKITAYAPELLAELANLPGWPEQVRTMQENWIGYSEGVEINFPVAGQNEPLTVFTTRPDTLFGATFLTIAPEHPLAIAVAHQSPAIAQFLHRCHTIKVAEAELATLPKEGHNTGLVALHPLTGAKLPIWVANFVLMEYGTGAIMSVPAHDTRDHEFANQYKLPITQVIKTTVEQDATQATVTTPGVLINSGEFSGLTSEEAIPAITTHLIQNKLGKRKTNYRLRDWGISRQRYWGAPLPIINCPNCGPLPVPEEQLPVLLPEGIKLNGPKSPLNTDKSFLETTCPKCKAQATRETDTFDTFMESSWYYARYCSPNQNSAIFDSRANYWLPVDQYIGGIEHAVMHLLYARFIYKVLRDEGLVAGDEPFTRLLTQGMVLKDGHKMSKSKGNVVAPTELISKYGADTVRLFMLFAAPPDQSLEWSDSGVAGAYRFLKKLYTFAMTHAELFLSYNNKEQPPSSFTLEQQQLRRVIHTILKQATFDMERLQFNTVVSAAMKLFNLLQDNAIPANALLLYEGFTILLGLLNPITPHLVHYLWHHLQFTGNAYTAPWPQVDPQALAQEEVELVVQVDGKLRGKIKAPNNATSTTLQPLALANKNVAQIIGDRTIKKVIVIPNKLINIVIT